MEELKLIVELLLLVIGGFIMGASYVGIRLEKVKKQGEYDEIKMGRRMKKFEEEFNYLIELSGKVLTGQIEAEKFETHRAIFLNEYGKKQHPEIPEVPQFVADWLDKKPLYTINSFIPVEIIGWSKKQTGYADLGMNINHLLKLKVNGYTVAKEKRFYLKNKLTGDCLARCLSRASSGLYVEVTEKWLTRKEQTSYQLSFTQQEIDSMETGSYEQMPVEES